MALSFRQIRYFMATAEAGKVSQAAANLSISQSAITTAIKDLEGELGTRLFNRHSNGVSLTYEGHQFMRHARGIDAAVSEAMHATRRFSEEVTGTVRIGVSYTVVGYFLPPLFERFNRTFPGITVTLHEMDRTEIEERLVSGTLDVAVMLVSNLQNRSEIAHETLVKSKRRLWACPDHPLMEKERVALADVAAEPFLMLTVDEAARTAMRYWDATPYRPNVIFETQSVEAVRSLVAAGVGVTILSDMVYRPWSLDGQRIEVRSVLDPVPSMDVGLAWHRGAPPAPATQSFIEYLTLNFSSGGTRFVGEVP